MMIGRHDRAPPPLTEIHTGPSRRWLAGSLAPAPPRPRALQAPRNPRHTRKAHASFLVNSLRHSKLHSAQVARRGDTALRVRPKSARDSELRYMRASYPAGWPGRGPGRQVRGPLARPRLGTERGRGSRARPPPTRGAPEHPAVCGHQWQRCAGRGHGPPRVSERGRSTEAVSDRRRLRLSFCVRRLHDFLCAATCSLVQRQHRRAPILGGRCTDKSI